MPDKDGLETLSEFRKRGTKIPVIILSGGGQIGVHVFIGAVRILGATRTLHKPFRMQDVLEATDSCFTDRSRT